MPCIPYDIQVDVFHRSGIRHFCLACEMAPLVVVLHYVNTQMMQREVSQTIPTSSICSLAYGNTEEKGLGDLVTCGYVR